MIIEQVVAQLCVGYPQLQFQLEYRVSIMDNLDNLAQRHILNWHSYVIDRSYGRPWAEWCPSAPNPGAVVRTMD